MTGLNAIYLVDMSQLLDYTANSEVYSTVEYSLEEEKTDMQKMLDSIASMQSQYFMDLGLFVLCNQDISQELPYPDDLIKKIYPYPSDIYSLCCELNIIGFPDIITDAYNAAAKLNLERAYHEKNLFYIRDFPVSKFINFLQELGRGSLLDIQ